MFNGGGGGGGPVESALRHSVSVCDYYIHKACTVYTLQYSVECTPSENNLEREGASKVHNCRRFHSPEL
jgi:hypothetical protein